MEKGNSKDLRKLGLSINLISVTEWLIIVVAFLGRYMLQFYQTAIGYTAGFFGLNTTQVGIAFALFGVAFGLAAFIVHKISPSKFRILVAISLLILGLTMPLYLVIHGAIEIYALMTLDGLITGIYMDALMTMGGMASKDQKQRQIDQSAFSFWVSTALIIAPFTTGILLSVLNIKYMFAIFAIMAFVAIPVLLLLHGKHSLQYVEHRSDAEERTHPTALNFLFHNKNKSFNASLIASLGNKIPYFIVLSFGVLYGKLLGFTPQQIFYLIAVMFAFNIGARLFVMLKSPISNKLRYMEVAMIFAASAAIILPLSVIWHPLFYLVFPLAGIPEGILWPIGLQLANTTFKSHEIGSSTAFFSSGMMIMAALMPILGWIISTIGYEFSFLVFGAITVAFLIWLLSYVKFNESELTQHVELLEKR
ncbi:MAG: MFS transporter [Thermotogae bacterium]|jgi:MFS family permease|nr:MFS transporter [Thermotogota bacterium]MCL5031956.1 MFS transporter [Thermotogota bacterium]